MQLKKKKFVNILFNKSYSRESVSKQIDFFSKLNLLHIQIQSLQSYTQRRARKLENRKKC